MKRNCPCCGDAFETRRKAQRYCSRTCSSVDRRRKPIICPTCGEDFVPQRREQRFCCRSCSKVLDRNPNWLGDAAQTKTKRDRIQSRLSLVGVACEICSEPATDRHHIDGDTGNNELINIACLCRRCHMESDGRLAHLAAMGRASRKPSADDALNEAGDRAYEAMREER